MDLPRRIEELDSAWLTDAMRASGRIAGDAAVTLRAWEPVKTGTAYATLMYRLLLDGPNGAPGSAIVKLPMEGEIRQLLDAIGAYRRETTFYGEFADEVPVRVPEPYVVATSDDSTDFVLVIEDLSGFEPANQLKGLTLEQAETAVDALAQFHAWSWEHERLAGLADRFPRLDGEWAAGIYGQFAQFFAGAWEFAREHPSVHDDVKSLGDRWGDLMPFFIDQLSAPRTIAHGELRAENLFLRPDGGLVLIDFQTVAQQAGIVDLAYLVAGSIPAEERRGRDEDLVRRYHEGLESAGVRGYSLERAWEQYRIALAFNLHLTGIAFGQYEQTDDRGKELLVEMLARSSDAIVSTGALDVLP